MSAARDMIVNSSVVPRRCCERPGYTYVIACCGLVKIGSANDVMDRVAGIQAMCPMPIEIVGVSRGKKLERYLHVKCERWRRHGEWFSFDAWHDIKNMFGGPRCVSCLLMQDDAAKQGIRRQTREVGHVIDERVARRFTNNARGSWSSIEPLDLSSKTFEWRGRTRKW